MDEHIQRLAKLFGANEDPELLSGGEGKTYRAGNIIIKPTTDIAETEEVAEIFHALPAPTDILLPSPVKSTAGNWVEDGHSAWTYIEGKTLPGEYEKKIEACRLFSEAVKNVGKPRCIEARTNPWAIADRVAWGELEVRYEEDFQATISRIQSALRPNALPFQLIHGDIAGNIISTPDGRFGIIDLTLYWRPAEYATALLVVDAVTWEGADAGIAALIQDVSDCNQLLLRAALRRIIEQPEQMKAFGKPMDVAVYRARKHMDTLRILNLI